MALLPYDVAMELAENFAACGWNALVSDHFMLVQACSLNLSLHAIAAAQDNKRDAQRGRTLNASSSFECLQRCAVDAP